MMKAVGSVHYDDGEIEDVPRSSEVQVYRYGDGEMQQVAGPTARTTKEKVAAHLEANPEAKATEIAEATGVSLSSVYRALRERKAA